MKNILENMSKENLIATIRQKDIATKKLEAKISNLQFQISQLQRLLYGSKRERFISEKDDKQLKLPFDVEEQAEQAEEKKEVSYTRNKSRKNHPGRFPLPDHLPVNEIVIEPKENIDGLKLIGKEVTDELDYTPGKLHINRFIRPKYAKQDNEGIVVAQLPSRPIEKGIAGAGLLANIEVDK
jgi:transposase